MRTCVHRLAMAVLAATLVLVACGGGDDAADGAGDGDASAPTTTERGAGNDATIVATIPDIPGLSDECEGLANVMLGVIQAFAGAIEGTDQLFAAGTDSLPSELQGDVDVLRQAVTEFAAAMEEIGVNPFTDPNAFATMTQEQLEQFEQVTEIFDNDAVDEAFESIEQYGERECDEFNIGG